MSADKHDPKKPAPAHQPPAPKPAEKAAAPKSVAPAAADPDNGSPPPMGIEPPEPAGAHATHASVPRDVPGASADAKSVPATATAAAPAKPTPATPSPFAAAEMADLEGKDRLKAAKADHEREMADLRRQLEKDLEEVSRQAEREFGKLRDGQPPARAPEVGTRFLVTCGDPTVPDRVVVAQTAADAKEKFLAVMGIRSTTYPLSAEPTDDPAG